MYVMQVCRVASQHAITVLHCYCYWVLHFAPKCFHIPIIYANMLLVRFLLMWEVFNCRANWLVSNDQQSNQTNSLFQLHNSILLLDLWRFTLQDPQATVTWTHWLHFLFSCIIKSKHIKSVHRLTLEPNNSLIFVLSFL